MITYKLVEYKSDVVSVIKFVNSVFELGIPFDPANTDYQTFKKAINDDTAQLEDADGNLMTAEAAKAFIKTLP